MPRFHICFCCCVVLLCLSHVRGERELNTNATFCMRPACRMKDWPPLICVLAWSMATFSGSARGKSLDLSIRRFSLNGEDDKHSLPVRRFAELMYLAMGQLHQDTCRGLCRAHKYCHAPFKVPDRQQEFVGSHEALTGLAETARRSWKDAS